MIEIEEAVELAALGVASAAATLGRHVSMNDARLMAEAALFRSAPEIARLHEVMDAKDTEIARLTAEVEALTQQYNDLLAIVSAGRDDSDGPDRGHTFRVGVEIRGSSRVGDEPHRDASTFQPLSRPVEVRAWNLRAALQSAALLSLSAWSIPDEED